MKDEDNEGRRQRFLFQSRIVSLSVVIIREYGVASTAAAGWPLALGPSNANPFFGNNAGRRYQHRFKYITPDNERNRFL
jgi:hypothetical protein